MPRHSEALQLWQCPGTVEHCSCGSALHNGALQLWQCLATMEHCLWQCLVTMEHFLWQFLGTMEHCLWHSPGRPRFGYATETNPGFLLIFQDQHQALQQWRDVCMLLVDLMASSFNLLKFLTPDGILGKQLQKWIRLVFILVPRSCNPAIVIHVCNRVPLTIKPEKGANLSLEKRKAESSMPFSFSWLEKGQNRVCHSSCLSKEKRELLWDFL